MVQKVTESIPGITGLGWAVVLFLFVVTSPVSLPLAAVYLALKLSRE